MQIIKKDLCVEYDFQKWSCKNYQLQLQLINPFNELPSTYKFWAGDNYLIPPIAEINSDFLPKLTGFQEMLTLMFVI